MEPIKDHARGSRVEGAVRILLAGLFIYAGWVKFLDPGSFASAVRSFRLVPDSVAEPMAMVLPVFEMSLGLLLLGGAWKRPALFGINALNLLFMSALSWALYQGLDVDCGCFGSASLSSWNSTWLAWIRDLFLLGGGLFLYARFLQEGGRPAPGQLRGRSA